MSNSIIPHVDSHKDLGLMLPEDLSWNKHYKDITARVYKTLRLICRTCVPMHSFTFYIGEIVCIISKIAVAVLYANLASTSNEDIVSFERIQCRATKHMLVYLGMISPVVPKTV